MSSSFRITFLIAMCVAFAASEEFAGRTMLFNRSANCTGAAFVVDLRLGECKEGPPNDAGVPNFYKITCGAGGGNISWWPTAGCMGNAGWTLGSNEVDSNLGGFLLGNADGSARPIRPGSCFQWGAGQGSTTVMSSQMFECLSTTGSGSGTGSPTKLNTCMDVKKVYQNQKCCEFPTKAFTMPEPEPTAAPAQKRRLSAGELRESVKAALDEAKMEGGTSEAASLATALIRVVNEHTKNAA